MARIGHPAIDLFLMFTSGGLFLARRADKHDPGARTKGVAHGLEAFQGPRVMQPVVQAVKLCGRDEYAMYGGHPACPRTRDF